MDCQQSADAKAFKAFTGRGRADEAVRLAAELDRIHAAMAELALASKTVPGRAFYLSVHRRALSGQQCLRWRSVRGNRHLPWASMPGLFAAQLPALASWYATVQERVEALNHAECVVRGELRHVDRKA
jgi:hypothetical protein